MLIDEGEKCGARDCGRGADEEGEGEGYDSDS